MSVKEAAITLYKELPKKFILTRATERLRTAGSPATENDADDILNRVASYIASKLPVYGKQQSARVPSKIAADEMKLLSFQEGATLLKHLFYPESDFYSDLKVKRDEFNALAGERTL